MNKHERTNAIMELIDVQKSIKELQKREKALKETIKSDFPTLETSGYLDGFGCGAEWSVVLKRIWDNDKVEAYLTGNGLDVNAFKKDSTAGTLKVRARA